MTVRFASRLGAFTTVRSLGSVNRIVSDLPLSIDGSGRVFVTWLDAVKPGDTFARAVYAEAHGTTFGAPAPLAFQPGITNSAMVGAAPGFANIPSPGWLPFASAAPGAAQMVVTYAGRAAGGTPSPVGQIDFPLTAPSSPTSTKPSR